MRVPRTRRDPTSDEDPRTPDTFVTADSHWWDGSQIYGSDERFAAAVRAGEDGNLRIDPDGLAARSRRARRPERRGGNLGRAAPHTLFMLEHNAICDRLRRAYPGWSDDRLYNTARLINAALMAKIHTTEWTPAIIAHPTTRYAMRATWSGIAGARLGRRLGHLGSGELLSGIPGSKTDHHTAPYSLTEEFVAVYRMHPLLPDEFEFRSLADDELLEQRSFPSSVRFTPGGGWKRSASRTRCTRSGSHIRGRSRCTTTHASSSTWSVPTAPAWTSRPPTSCASASAESPATTSSGACFGYGRRRRSRS